MILFVYKAALINMRTNENDKINIEINENDKGDLFEDGLEDDLMAV